MKYFNIVELMVIKKGKISNHEKPIPVSLMVKIVWQRHLAFMVILFILMKMKQNLKMPSEF